MKKIILSVVLLVLIGFTVLVAQAGFKKRSFSGNAIVQVCTKDASGKWQVVDELTAPLSFDFAIADVAKNKDVNTTFGFTGRTRKGLSVSARLKKGAIGNSDLSTGLVQLELPLDLTVNGKKVETVFKFTTESAAGAAGNISGRRAKIDTAAKSAQLSMVSSALIKDASGVIDEIIDEPSVAQRQQSPTSAQQSSAVDQKKESPAAAEKKESSSASQKKESAPASQKKEIIAEKKELFVVISGDGLLKSLEK